MTKRRDENRGTSGPAMAAGALRRASDERRGDARSPRQRPGSPSGAGTIGAAGIALWLLLAALCAARAAFTFGTGMWAWSLNLQRFLDPATAWILWSLAALALLPPVARRLLPALARAGDAIERRPALSGAGWGIAAAALVGLAPDRVRFVGDFLLRQGTVEVAEQPGVLFPQALPLDVFLHYTVPSAVTAAALGDANGVARVVGMIEAALLALLALALVRTLALRGAAGFAAAAVVVCGGYLGMFTGFSKAFAELCLLVACTGVFGLRVIREGKGLLPLGFAVATGVTLHRSALGLVPAALLAFALWVRDHGWSAVRRDRRTLAGLAISVLTLAVMVPRIVSVVLRWDAVHFKPHEAQRQGGVLASALAGHRPLDLANLVLLLSPLALAIPVLLPFLSARPVTAGAGASAPSPGARPMAGRGRELLLLVVLALPFVGVMPFIHPAQGLFRDWDDFAATGVALSLIAAWTIGLVLAATPARAVLALAVALGALVPALQWLAHNRDLDRGLARVRAFMVEPPRRSDEERGTTWDFLGISNFRLDRYPAAAEAFSKAAETSPSPRILQQWALASTLTGDYDGAQRSYRRMLEKAPENALGWLGLATVSANLHDYAEAKRAANELLRLQPGNTDARNVLAEVARMEAESRSKSPPGSPRP